MRTRLGGRLPPAGPAPGPFQPRRRAHIAGLWPADAPPAMRCAVAAPPRTPTLCPPHGLVARLWSPYGPHDRAPAEGSPLRVRCTRPRPCFGGQQATVTVFAGAGHRVHSHTARSLTAARAPRWPAWAPANWYGLLGWSVSQPLPLPGPRRGTSDPTMATHLSLSAPLQSGAPPWVQSILARPPGPVEHRRTMGPPLTSRRPASRGRVLKKPFCRLGKGAGATPWRTMHLSASRPWWFRQPTAGSSPTRGSARHLPVL